jgi:cation-transporting ATPase E
MTQTTWTPLVGLTEAEVAQRQAQGLVNVARAKTGRSYGQIAKDNLLTFFNLVLFSLGLILWALGSPRDAFFTAAIALLNAVVGTVQEVRAKRKLDRIALLTRPKATVIRAGREQQIDPAAVVQDDLLVVGPGDQAIVDGPVVQGAADFDEALLTGEADPAPKRAGDQILSGSYVLTGKLVYQAQKIGDASFANQLVQRARQFTREQTPLQSEVNLVVRVLLLVVAFFGVLITINQIINRDQDLLQSVQAASVVFGLAPASLFLMIVVTYALGAVRIADKGALVQRANAVESLSHVDVLCLDKTGTLTANKIQLDAVQPLGALDENAVRCALGRYARSGTAGNRTSEAVAEAVPGESQPFGEEVPFSSARKWSALVFDGPDLPGIYVLGAPEMLRAYLTLGAADWEGTAGELAVRGQRVLLFACRPEVSPLHVDGQPCLPAGLQPLALLSFSDELRPDARSTLDGFRQAGVEIKIISGDNPATVLALARQAGMGEQGETVEIISGPELEALDDDDFARAAARHTIFGRITPEQKQRLVQALREQGRYVAMTGDGVNDVLALKQAKLSIAMESGAQATRSVADIVLLGDSFAALPEALLEGQRIMNSMGDVLRLYLTRSFALAFLIATISMLAIGFPYTPAQNSVISIFVLTIPAFGLALWAKPGPVPSGGVVRQLVNFVLPASVVTGTFLFLVYLVFIETTSDWPYTQLALTYATIATGLLLVVFVQPPTEFWVGGDALSGDWRPTLLAIGLFAVLLVSPYVPILNSFFGLQPLRNAADQAIVAGIVLAWMTTLRLVWRHRLVDRYLDVDLSQL